MLKFLKTKLGQVFRALRDWGGWVEIFTFSPRLIDRKLNLHLFQNDSMYLNNQLSTSAGSLTEEHKKELTENNQLK